MSALPLNQVFEFDFQVHNPAATNGPLIDADSTPTYDVYEQGSRTPILAAQSATHDTTGVYYGSITCSAANGFDVGKTYQVKATAVVGGVTDKAVLSRFRIVAAETTVGVPKVEATTLSSGAITSTAFAADAITASAIAADAIGSSELAATAANEIADAYLDRTSGIETGITPRQAQRLILASQTGILSGAATTTETIRDINNTKNRIVATVDSDGNRSSVTVDAS